MMSRNEVRAVVSMAVELAIQRNGGVVSRDWAAQHIISTHMAEVTNGSFAHFAFAEWTAREVAQFFNKMQNLDGQMEGMPEQLKLDYPNMKAWYVLTRNETLVAVQVWECTNKELLSRADLYEANARSLLSEAEDMRRYVAAREV